jgi:hypothetical protein
MRKAMKCCENRDPAFYSDTANCPSYNCFTFFGKCGGRGGLERDLFLELGTDNVPQVGLGACVVETELCDRKIANNLPQAQE